MPIILQIYALSTSNWFVFKPSNFKKYIIYREGKYFVAQCLNVDVSSFGKTIEEAQNNIKEALELYFEGNAGKKEYVQIDEVLVGETVVHV